MKKAGLASVLLLVLCFVAVFQVLPVDAQSSVYIRADGTVEGTDKITQNGDVYTLTADINGEIIVEKDGITLDGVKHVLRGTGAEHSVGVNLRARSNITVSRLRIESFYTGIYVLPQYLDLFLPANNSKNNKLIQNTVTNCTVAIALSDSANNEVTQNTLQHNEYAIQIVESNPTVIFGNNMIKQNTITDNTYAIWIQRTASNTITENIIQNNINAIDGKTGAMSNYNTVHHNAFINNTANIANPQLKIQWDDGKEGNYWSDYNGTDTTGDGVGETPYTIYIVMQDTHPLVNMIPEFPTTTTLPLFALATVLAAAFYRKIKTN